MTTDSTAIAPAGLPPATPARSVAERPRLAAPGAAAVPPRWRGMLGSIGKLARTTVFKLTLVYLTVFALFAGLLLGYFAWTTQRLMTDQIVATVDAEITGLAEQYRQGGIRRLVIAVDNRARRPGSNVYLLTTFNGQVLSGNVGSLPSGTMANTGWIETPYSRMDEQDTGRQFALARVFQLPGGFRLMVGRDLEERQRLNEAVWSAGRWSAAIVVVLGLAGGFFLTRRMLKRVDAMTATARTIMAGDFSGRLPVSGTGDELDRLAENLNSMLERIEALMRGLKEVSDNIAHDLRTPLTRLRNRAEEALADAGNEAEYRAALERTIEESDGLIRTFNALLMIARAESGQARANMADFDAADAVRDIAELYEPLAEDKGLTLKVETRGEAIVHGNRELLSQALANLLDNAIKYMPPAAPDGATEPVIVLEAGAAADGRIVLAVCDRGPGIPAADRGRAVERFVRLEASRSAPGSGLGLSLAAAVARLHGGELRLEDNRPGLRAALVLPRAAPGLLSASGPA